MLQYKVKIAFEPLQISIAEEDDNGLGVYIVDDLKEDIYDYIILEIIDFEGNTLYKGKFHFSSLNHRDLITRNNLNHLEFKKNEFFVKVNFRNLQRVYVPGKPKDWKLRKSNLQFSVNESQYGKTKIDFNSEHLIKDALFLYEGRSFDYLEEIIPNQNYSIYPDVEFKDFKIEKLNINH